MSLLQKQCIKNYHSGLSKFRSGSGCNNCVMPNVDQFSNSHMFLILTRQIHGEWDMASRFINPRNQKLKMTTRRCSIYPRYIGSCVEWCDLWPVAWTAAAADPAMSENKPRCSTCCCLPRSLLEADDKQHLYCLQLYIQQECFDADAGRWV